MKKLNPIRGLLLAGIAASMVFSSVSASADAAATYKAKCAMCHGADGKGDTPAGKKMGTHDFASPEVKKESDAELAAIVAGGKNKMPAYKTLKDTEIKDLVTYIRQLGK